jgi:hypothetical protein
MTRTVLIAVGVVVLAMLAYFAVVDRNDSVMTTGTQPATVPAADTTAGGTTTAGTTSAGGTTTGGTTAGGATTGDTTATIAGDNVSNRVGGDLATDGAFEAAREGEEPVQGNVDRSRVIAGETGAVGGSAFTVEGYDRITVIEAIATSDLDEAEKQDLMQQLDAAEPVEARLEEALADVRLALAEAN